MIQEDTVKSEEPTYLHEILGNKYDSFGAKIYIETVTLEDCWMQIYLKGGMDRCNCIPYSLKHYSTQEVICIYITYKVFILNS